MDDALSEKVAVLKRGIDRINLLSSHDALIILKVAISSPKVLFILRTSTSSDHPQLPAFDNILRLGLSLITNNSVSDTAWLQASLPVRDGGLGIRSVALLAPSAFLASAASTLELQSMLLSKCSVAVVTGPERF